MRRLGRDDFHHVAVFKFGREGLFFAVDAASAGFVADVRVNLVGKVDGAGSLGESHGFGFRRKDVDLIGKQIDLDVFDEFRGVRTGALNVKKALQPGGDELLQFARVEPVVVHPVRKKPHFINAVHRFGTDLVFDRGARGTDHRGVQTLVAVRFWDGDEVLKAPMHRFVELMNGAKRQVALFLGAHDDAEAVNVQDV